MALDVLTVQSMSDECERLFSAAGNVQTERRSKLDMRMVATSMALRSWYRAGIVRDIDPMLLSVTEEVENQLLEGMGHREAERRTTRWLRMDGDDKDD